MIYIAHNGDTSRIKYTQSTSRRVARFLGTFPTFFFSTAAIDPWLLFTTHRKEKRGGKKSKKTLIVYRSSWSFRDCRDFDLVRRRRWRSVVAANLWAGRDSLASVELLLTRPSSSSTNVSTASQTESKTFCFMTTKSRPFPPSSFLVFGTHTPRTTHTHTHKIYSSTMTHLSNPSVVGSGHTQTKLVKKKNSTLGKGEKENGTTEIVGLSTNESRRVLKLCVCVTRRGGNNRRGTLLPDSLSLAQTAVCVRWLRPLCLQGEGLPLVECPAAIFPSGSCMESHSYYFFSILILFYFPFLMALL